MNATALILANNKMVWWGKGIILNSVEQANMLCPLEQISSKHFPLPSPSKADQLQITSLSCFPWYSIGQTKVTF